MVERVKPYQPETNYWLLQTEPEEYGWDDLERDDSTVWNGVTDYASLKNVRDVDEGDQVFIYHKGDEPAIVGIARVISDAYPDPDGTDPTVYAFDIEPVERLENPIPLSAILDDPDFQDWELISNPDMEVVEVPAPLWNRLLEICRAGLAQVAQERV